MEHRHRVNDGFHLVEDQRRLQPVDAGRITLAAQLAFRPQQMAQHQPGHQPGFAIAPRLAEDAEPHSFLRLPAIQLVHECDLVRQQLHLFACALALGHRQKLQERDDALRPRQSWPFPRQLLNRLLRRNRMLRTELLSVQTHRSPRRTNTFPPLYACFRTKSLFDSTAGVGRGGPAILTSPPWLQACSMTRRTASLPWQFRVLREDRSNAVREIPGHIHRRHLTTDICAQFVQPLSQSEYGSAPADRPAQGYLVRGQPWKRRHQSACVR